MKNIFFILAALSILFITGESAADAQEKAGSSNVSVQPQNAGNKICPVTGEEINEATKATYEYEGKVYNLCCAMCIDEFKKDPKKYIKKTEEEQKE